MATKQTKTSKPVKHVAGKGLENPSSISKKDVRKLAASVEAHIEPRGKKKGK